MKKISIRTKLILLMLLVLIPVVILNAVRIKTDFKKSLEAEYKASEDFAQAFSESFMNYVEKTWSEQYTIGLAIGKNDGWDQEDIEDYFDEVIKLNKELINISWVSLDGTVLASVEKIMVGKSIKQREYYTRLINGEEKTISNLVQGYLNHEALLPVARKILVDNKPIGILVSTIDVNKLNTIFSTDRIGETSSYGLIDKNGMIVFRKGSLYLQYEKRKISSDAEAWVSIKEGKTMRIKGVPSMVDNTVRMGVTIPIPQINWACFVTTSEGELLGNYRQDMYGDIAILLLITICSLIVAILFGNRFINALVRFKEATEEVAKGNFDVKTNIAGFDELDVTSQAFDLMTEKVNTKIHETEEDNRLKSHFFATISHELKTPLNVILASTQLMERLDNRDTDMYDSKMRRHLGLLKQNSLRLLRLICNLIDVNKLEVSQLSITPQNLDIVHIVENISLSVAEYARQKNIDLIFDTQMEEKTIAFDPDMIERIMLNLLSNAIKFTDANGKIYVNIYDRLDTIAISVKDTGIGIPKDMHEKIFNCFTQVDGSLHRKTEGSGIGLSLVQSLVELHGGSISLTSEIGSGSEFIIELPNVLCVSEEESQLYVSVANVERIRVEFSDIYL